MKTGHFALVIVLAFGVCAIATTAQDGSQRQNSAQAAAQADSLAAVARQARAERKDQPKAAKVFTNDNLPTNATISYVGSSAPAPKDAAASVNTAADQTKAGAKSSGSGDKASDNAALAKAKQQLESAKKDLDIDQRKFALDQQDYLSNPNHGSDAQTAATLQSEQDGISAKKDEVDAAQKVVDDLKARSNADTETASSAPAPSNAPAANTKAASGTSASNSAATNSGNSNSSENGSSDSNSTGATPDSSSPPSPASGDSDGHSL